MSKVPLYRLCATCCRAGREGLSAHRQDKYWIGLCSGSEAGSCLRLTDSCITQLTAQGPSRTGNGSKEEEEGLGAWSFPREPATQVLASYLYYLGLLSSTGREGMGAEPSLPLSRAPTRRWPVGKIGCVLLLFCTTKSILSRHTHEVDRFEGKSLGIDFGNTSVCTKGYRPVVSRSLEGLVTCRGRRGTPDAVREGHRHVLDATGVPRS